MSFPDINYNKVKALLRSPIEQNQQVALALLIPIQKLPNDDELWELMTNSSDKLLWCQDFGLAPRITTVKLDMNFKSTAALNLGAFANLQNLYFNRQKWNTGQIPFHKLKKLETIRVSYSFLRKMPVNFRMLPKLETLYFDSNNLTRFDTTIGHLKNLKTLVLTNNQITSLSAPIGNLTKLKHLDVANNKLRDISNKIGHLAQLETLNLSKNHLEALPRGMVGLKNLKILNISNNRIADSLPQEIYQLKNLEKLYLAGNPIVKSKKIINKLKSFLPNTQIISKHKNLKIK